MVNSSISAPSWLDAVQVQRFDRLYDATPSATLTLGAALDAIVDGDCADAITTLRQIYARQGEDAYAAAKKRLPQVTFGGVFSPTRAKANLVQHSGLVHADLDHLQDLAQSKLALMQDPHVVYIFISPRSDGLKYGTRITPVDSDAAYQHAWQMVCDQHQEQYGIVWDPSGKDVSRLCFVSWDPACYINADAAVFPVPPMVVPAPPPASSVRFHAPYARPYGESAAERALSWAQQCILASHPGERHHARCKAAYLLGGYVGAGLLTYDEAYAVLETAVRQTSEDIPKALRTIQDGLTAGATRPLTAEKVRPIPQMTTMNAREVPTWRA